MKKPRIPRQPRVDLQVTRLELASLCLAINYVQSAGPSDAAGCFPARSDLAALGRLHERAWDRLLEEFRYVPEGRHG